MGSVAEELSVPLWVGEHTCAVTGPTGVPPFAAQARGGPGSSPFATFLSHSVVSQRVCVERRKRGYALWHRDVRSETAEGRGSSLPCSAHLSCELPASCQQSRQTPFCSGSNCLRGSFLFDTPPPSTQKDIYPLISRSTCTRYY